MVLRKRLTIDGPALFFITTTIRNWTPVFSNPLACHSILNDLHVSSDFFEIEIAGYVIMPSHIHMLVGMSDSSILSKFMQQFKSVSSRRILPSLSAEILQLLGERERPSLWIPRFDDVLIVSEKQFQIKLEYIHNNPVKGGLAKRAQDYEWSSAQDWLTGSTGKIRVCKDFEWTSKM